MDKIFIKKNLVDPLSYFIIYRSVHAEQAPVAKVAELKKLKTCASERQVLGPEMTSGAVSSI